MKELFLNKSISWIEKNQNYSEGDIRKIKYGLEGIYLTFTKLVVMFFLAFILNITKELILLLFFFNFLRFTGFGFHAKKSSECLILSTALFVLFPYLLLNINLDNYIILIFGVLGTIYLFLYAPADTIKRPLPNLKKRKIRKIVTTIMALIYTIVAYKIADYNIATILISALLIECFMVSPITYKLFGQPYNNYLNYIKT